MTDPKPDEEAIRCPTCRRADKARLPETPLNPGQEIEKVLAAVRKFESRFTPSLRALCEEIGYGRVIQIVEGWMEEKHPGWLAARSRVASVGADASCCRHGNTTCCREGCHDAR